ncbi:MAG: hypothetical protein KH453_07500, partial [[Eubacterium] siraeum]|jgi:hypothetical protein|nr:hypothetical protein [[Eubacterium] siraeum]MED9919491.1 hypothetical protein [[Eubacterium] siraeum]
MENYINSLFSINHALQNGFKSILDKYKVSNSSLPTCPLREEKPLSQRAFLLYARSYINPQLTCPQKTAIINLYKQEDLLKCSEPVTFAMAKVLGKVKKSKEQ